MTVVTTGSVVSVVVVSGAEVYVAIVVVGTGAVNVVASATGSSAASDGSKLPSAAYSTGFEPWYV